MNKHKLTIDTLAYGGDAVGRLESGKVCFVPGGLPGEELEVVLIQEKSGFARGEVVKVLKAATQRIAPPCPAYKKGCPGCAYLHCDYETELKWKQQQFTDFLTRSGLLDRGEVLPPEAAPQRLEYRNKLKLHTATGGKFGMVARDNETVIPVSKCLLAVPEISAAVNAHPGMTAKGSVTWRFTEHDSVIFYTQPAEMKKSNWLTEELPGVGKFKVPAAGFFQTNTAVAGKLVARAVEEIIASGCDKLTELYCGVGIFSIAAAQKLPQLKSAGIEVMHDSIKAARWNAKKHEVETQCRFFAGDAGSIFSKSDCRGGIILVDPPRSGLSRQVIEAIVRARPEKIIYISCAADTLRRDLQLFQKEKYAVDTAGIFDMFPATAHFESMVTLINQ